MPSTNKTFYGLNRWTEEDVPVMDDFNSDNQVIDSEMTDLMTLSNDNQSAISELEDKKANKSDILTKAEVDSLLSSKPFTIPVGAWVSTAGVANFPFSTTITVNGLTASDDAMVFFDINSVITAQSVGICSGVGKTVTDGIVIYTRAQPSTALTGSYVIVKGGA